MGFGTVADPSREEQMDVAKQIFDRVRAMYTALEEKGRRGVIRALREGIPTGSPADASARPHTR
jgi:hypothetical protein